MAPPDADLEEPLGPVEHPPVQDWTTDFDHTISDWAQNAPEIWRGFRSGCPVAHTERFGGCWFPSRHEDVSQIAHDTEHFSSRGIIVNDMGFRGDAPVGYAPPISSDPPFHAVARKLLLGPFSPKAVAELEPATRDTCRRLAAEVVATAGDADGLADAATDYAQHIPVRVIAHMLGLPESDGDRFRGFIHRVLEKPGQVAVAPDDTMAAYLEDIIPARRDDPGDDLISYLVQADIEGMPLTDDHVFGSIALLLIAGIDTTWSAIGASLWHLAQHPEHVERLREDPDVWPFAIEEFLRFYAPVTMARVVSEDVTIGECRDGRGRLGAAAVPLGQPRRGRLRGRRGVRHRPPPQPARGLRAGDPPVCGFQPRPHGAAGGARGVGGGRRPVRAGRPGPLGGEVVHGPGAGPTGAAGTHPRPHAQRHRGSRSMRITYEREACQGHNRCYLLAPEVFDVDDEGYAVLRIDGEVPAELEEKARLAADNCPEYAITIED